MNSRQRARPGHAPFVTLIGERFGIKGEVVTGVTASDLPALMRRSQFFMDSVHHTIRWPGQNPTASSSPSRTYEAVVPSAERLKLKVGDKTDLAALERHGAACS